MPELRELEDGDGRLRLPGRMDMQIAPALRDWFLARDEDATLDASQVDVLTTPALQVLMAGRDHLEQQGLRLSLENQSDAFIGCLATLGVSADRLVSMGETV